MIGGDGRVPGQKVIALARLENEPTEAGARFRDVGMAQHDLAQKRLDLAVAAFEQSPSDIAQPAHYLLATSRVRGIEGGIRTKIALGGNHPQQLLSGKDPRVDQGGEKCQRLPAPSFALQQARELSIGFDIAGILRENSAVAF